MLLAKDREEQVNVTFDFTAFEIGPVLADPVVDVAHDFGDDALTVQGTPAVAGLKVTASIGGGTPGCVYDLTCTATFDNGEVRSESAALAVT
ncbi:MAG: hypothetical protein ABI601_18595 [bacterium]